MTTKKVTKESTTWHCLRVINRVLIQKSLLYRETKGDRAGAFVHQRNLNWSIASNQNLPNIQKCLLCLERKQTRTHCLVRQLKLQNACATFDCSFKLTHISNAYTHKIAHAERQAHLYEAFRAHSHHFKGKLWLVTSRSLDGPEGESGSDCVCFFCQWAEGPYLDL